MSTVEDIFDSKSDPMHCMHACTSALAHVCVRAHTHTKVSYHKPNFLFHFWEKQYDKKDIISEFALNKILY